MRRHILGLHHKAMEVVHVYLRHLYFAIRSLEQKTVSSIHSLGFLPLPSTVKPQSSPKVLSALTSAHSLAVKIWAVHVRILNLIH